MNDGRYEWRADDCDCTRTHHWSTNNRSNKETTIYDLTDSLRTANFLMAVRISRFSTFNQNSSNKEMTTYNLHSCPACELRISSSRHTELEIFNNQNSSNKEMMTYDLHSRPACELRISSSWHTEHHQSQRDDDLRSALMSAVHVNFLRTADLLFMA